MLLDSAHRSGPAHILVKFTVILPNDIWGHQTDQGEYISFLKLTTSATEGGDGRYNALGCSP